MLILSGDIGGTKTRMALIRVEGDELVVDGERTYPSAEFASLSAILASYMGSIGARPQAVGLGLAGPVRGRRCEATNLPWLIDATALETALGLPRVHLLNDLEATAWGIRALGPGDVVELGAGVPDPEGNLSVIAAGTGLGEAGICRRDGGFQPFASEGGHTDFAPSDELEFGLHRFLAARHGHVSWERVVSGLGIPALYEYLCQVRGAVPGEALRLELEAGAGAVAIAAAADLGDPLCEEAMDLFVRLYGREAGNHALKVMATGGVYLGGGIAPKVLERLRRPAFLEAFRAKGRMRPLMEAMPVRVILNDRAALYGAALAGAAALQSGIR